MKHSAHSGFTLVEVVITATILSAVFGIAMAFISQTQNIDEIGVNQLQHRKTMAAVINDITDAIKKSKYLEVKGTGGAGEGNNIIEFTVPMGYSGTNIEWSEDTNPCWIRFVPDGPPFDEQDPKIMQDINGDGDTADSFQHGHLEYFERYYKDMNLIKEEVVRIGKRRDYLIYVSQPQIEAGDEDVSGLGNTAVSGPMFVRTGPKVNNVGTGPEIKVTLWFYTRDPNPDGSLGPIQVRPFVISVMMRNPQD